MDIVFRKVRSPEAYQKVIDFLRSDVLQHGGSASETIDIWGQLWVITICKVPWGTLLLKRQVSKLEAIAELFAKED
jgi:hypothetical protein